MANQDEFRVCSDSNGTMELAILSVIGDRSNQEDNFGYRIQKKEGIVAVCDGMGGHSGGAKASTMAIESLLSSYDAQTAVKDPAGFLRDVATGTSSQIAALRDENGQPMRAGTTIVAALIQERRFYWVSVGDSRAYLLRNGSLQQLTTDHVYQMLLQQQLVERRISEEDYAREMQRGHALISFLGLEQLRAMDLSNTPVQLQSNDTILLATDGLYKLLQEEEIRRILENFSDVSDAVEALELKAKRNSRQYELSRDNITVSVIKIR